LKSGHEINTIVSKPDSPKPPLVLIHGWCDIFLFLLKRGSGLALWSKNFDDLSEHYQVYAIDLLGIFLKIHKRIWKKFKTKIQRKNTRRC
jgi:pimeloyl-ACP methyl ester carboxylesterase